VPQPPVAKAPSEPEKPGEPIRIEEEVSVVDRLGKKSGSPSGYTLTAGEIREMAGTLDNVFLAMQLLPGVVGTNDEDGKLAVRGAGPEHNLIVLDGVAIHNPLRFGDFTSSFMNPDTAATVEAEATTMETMAVLLQRLAIQSEFRSSRLIRLLLFLAARLVARLGWLITRQYGNSVRSEPVPEMLVTGWHVSAVR